MNVQNRTEVFEQFKEIIKKFTRNKAEAIAIIPAQKIIDAARVYASEKAGAIKLSETA